MNIVQERLGLLGLASVLGSNFGCLGDGTDAGPSVGHESLGLEVEGAVRDTPQLHQAARAVSNVGSTAPSTEIIDEDFDIDPPVAMAWSFRNLPQSGPAILTVTNLRDDATTISVDLRSWDTKGHQQDRSIARQVLKARETRPFSIDVSGQVASRDFSEELSVSVKAENIV